ncbi:MAG: hypothetical protein LBP33_06515, partial [Candidatus Adiutrix sp.]|nr:hypothetical protein [Candidatus Adiutrix sp.]
MAPESLKEQMLARLAAELPPEDVRRWFGALGWAYDPAAGRLTLTAPHIFHQRRLQDRYAALIGRLGREIGLALTEIRLSGREPRARPVEINLALPPPAEARPGRPAFNPEYGFERFLAADSNRLALTAARDFAEGLRNLGACSLLLVAAGPWGKTHLLEAVANRLARDGRRSFLRLDLTEAPGLERWSRADALIVDDVQKLGERPDWQRRLLHFFDESALRYRSLIISSPAPPQRLGRLSEALRSRLGGGLVLKIDPPEPEIMAALGQRRAAELDLYWPPEVQALLLREAGSDPRRLLGLIESLNFILGRSDLSPAQAAALLLTDHRPGPGESGVGLESILEGVASAFGLKVSDLTGHSKLRQAAWPRRVAMLLARELTSLTTTEIGRALGGRDHSTVIHALKKINEELKNPAQLKLVENIRRSIILS